MNHRILVCMFLMLAPLRLTCQITVGLIDRQIGSEDGYVLFAPSSSDTTYLIDKCGRKLHQWVSNYAPGQSVYLLEDGTLLRSGRANNPVFTAGGTGGIIEKFSWSGQLLWSYTVSNTTECQHHDIYPMPNGHVLVLAWDLKTPAEAIAAGRNPSLLGNALWSEKILELEPVGSTSANIVWQWEVWDHLVQEFDATKSNYGIISQHPELINLNYTTGAATRADWLHCNALDYNETLDQIMISNHNFSELWIIDHGTTDIEASGHTGGRYGKGGDLLYRWGNPQAYGRGSASTKKFFGQHNTQWIRAGLQDAGNILVFNNGLNRPAGNYSSVEIIAPIVDSAGNYPVPSNIAFGPDSAYWKYTAPVPTDFYSTNISGAQRLPGGNTMVCSGSNGIFFEIDSAKNTVWRYVSPASQGGNILSQGTTPTMNPVFRCTQYSETYPAFTGKALIPGDPLELNPLPNGCNMTTSLSDFSAGKKPDISIIQFPERLIIKTTGYEGYASITLSDMRGSMIKMWKDVMMSDAKDVLLQLDKAVIAGVHVLSVRTAGGNMVMRKLLLF
ncbi:MAG: aryl-sulfate sulfotransferase [Bacteroidota bacterium]